jgi:hypothetical protein
MQQVVKIGNRWFAVRKDMDRAERVASQSNVRGNWQRVMQSHKTARVVWNTKR